MAPGWEDRQDVLIIGAVHVAAKISNLGETKRKLDAIRRGRMSAWAVRPRLSLYEPLATSGIFAHGERRIELAGRGADTPGWGVALMAPVASL